MTRTRGPWEEVFHRYSLCCYSENQNDPTVKRQKSRFLHEGTRGWGQPLVSSLGWRFADLPHHRLLLSLLASPRGARVDLLGQNAASNWRNGLLCVVVYLSQRTREKF